MQSRSPACCRSLALCAGLAVALCALEATAGGQTAQEGRAATGPSQVRLRYATFDPIARMPGVPAVLTARTGGGVWLVQFHGTPTESMRSQVVALGGRMERFLTDNTHVVRIAPEAIKDVARLECVRWVGPFHPAYRLEPEVLAELVAGAESTSQRYSIEAGEPSAQPRIAAAIAGLGGAVELTTRGLRMEAMLTHEQLIEVLHLDDVHYVDRAWPQGADMDIARQLLGAAPGLSTAGFTGQGVRGEVYDTGLDTAHPALQNPPPLIHCAGTNPSSPDHGTAVYGIIFGSGAGNASATGMLPNAEQGIFCFSTSPSDPYARIEELVNPSGPYRAVFQSRAVGSAHTSAYSTISSEMDALFFTYDLLACQSQGNSFTGARPEAWAKNVVAVGGLQHQNTLSRADDSGTAYSAPMDGRIKPDVVGISDGILTTAPGAQFASFSGTSAATAMVSGAFGLVFQMWHQGVWHGFGGGSSVFDSKPAMSTARALIINSAFQYDWSAGGPNGTITRRAQGWGMPDLDRLYQDRAKTFIVNQTDLIEPLQTRTYTLTVLAGEPLLKATMVYLDPAGSPAAAQSRVNDLTLRVIAPDQTSYWGNHGLGGGLWSVPGGQADTANVVENVFIQNPMAGTWTVQVIGAQIVQDAAVQTPELDASFALVVTGVSNPPACYANCDGSTAPPVLNVADFTCFLQKFAAGDAYANCDGSTIPPVLNVADFTCFLQKFAAGCP